jgi:hypothetical protein
MGEGRVYECAVGFGSRRDTRRSGDARLAEYCEQESIDTGTQTIGEAGSAIKKTLRVVPVLILPKAV